MTVRTDLTVDLPALRSTLARTGGRCRALQILGTGSDGVSITVRHSDATPRDLVGQLEGDETVREIRQFQSADIVQVRAGRAALTYEAMVGRGAVIDDALATRHGWELALRFPDHQRLQEYWSVCRNRGHSVRVGRLRDAEDDGDILTPAQAEVLSLAREHAYFGIPRGAELNDLADELDISDQAASERLRRGIDRLLSDYFGATGEASRVPERPPTS